MKFVLTLVGIFYFLNETNYVSGSSPVETKWMTQKVDNFDDNNNQKWKMRYMVNEQYFKKDGPMFILVGGKNPIEASNIEWGLLVNLASEFNGILFYVEHRTYGESRIGRDLSMDTLKFLNAKQVLADLANFIKTQRKTDLRLANSKVIMTGSSYAGALAVWFKHIYPHMVDGTWSISGPLLAKVDFPEYPEIIGKAIRELGSPQCYDRIEKGMQKLEEMFNSDQAEKASKLLNMCDYFDYTLKEDIWALFKAILRLFNQLVINQSFDKETIPRACDFLIKRPNSLTAVVDYFLENYTTVTVDKNCKSLNYYGIVYNTNKTSYDNTGRRQWMYQQCNELGWFPDFNSAKQPFGKLSPFAINLQQCKDIFGPDFTEERIRQNIEKTNGIFGGLNPNVKNIYITYGGLDPWTSLGPGDSNISTIVPLYSQYDFLNSITYKDSDKMFLSKKDIFKLVTKWLA